MLNAIAPTDAQINIAKFNKSAIPAASGWIALVRRNMHVLLLEASHVPHGNRQCDCRRRRTALTLISVAK
jgi:hypothetical protein